MTKNTRFLLGMWDAAAPGLIAIGVVVGLTLWHGVVWPSLLLCALFGARLVLRKLGLADWRTRRLLQSRSPDRMIAVCAGATNRAIGVSGMDAVQAHSIAFVYTLYGEYESARTELQKINWASRPPLAQAWERSVLALHCYFETREYEHGLELARSARELGRSPRLIPGVRTSAAALESYVLIGEILCGRYSESGVRELEADRNMLPLLGQLIADWGLALAHGRTGDRASAEAARDRIRAVAPHCRALSLPASMLRPDSASKY